MKTLKFILKFMLLTFSYTVVNAVVFALLPFSVNFKTASLSQNAAPYGMVFTTVSTVWTVGTICFIRVNSAKKTRAYLLAAVGSVFFVQSFMTQIETLFFGHAFTTLSRCDTFLIVLAGAFPVFVAGMLAMVLFKRFDEQKLPKLNWGKFGVIAVLNGLIYMVVYFIFGYFVAWQSPELRLFYSGSTEMISFSEKLLDNFRTSPVIYPFQWMRGVLFTFSVLPLLRMRWKHKYDYFVGVVLVFLCAAVVLVIPNFLFPDAVRWTHFVEMFGSMLLFGVLTGVLTKRALSEQKTVYSISEMAV